MVQSTAINRHVSKNHIVYIYKKLVTLMKDNDLIKELVHCFVSKLYTETINKMY
jgi:hypothetical protein